MVLNGEYAEWEETLYILNHGKKKEEAEVDIFIITFPVVDYLRKKEDWNE